MVFTGNTTIGQSNDCDVLVALLAGASETQDDLIHALSESHFATGAICLGLLVEPGIHSTTLSVEPSRQRAAS